jgi:hypothetical protein
METRIDKTGYEAFTKVDRNERPIFVHIVIAEKALGKQMPPKAVVHHVNEIKTDNRPANLVICPDHAYHKFLHQRLDAKKACGHADWRKCGYCKQYDEPANLYIPNVGMPRHLKCFNAYRRKLNQRGGEKCVKQ